jgi:hypothetical protein
MDHVHEQTRVGRGQGIDEEVTRLWRQPLVLDFQGVDHLGQVEQHALHVRNRHEHGPQQMTAAAADIGDRLEAAEVVGIEDGRDVGGRLRGHRLPEDLAFVGVILEVSPEPCRLNGLDGR